MFDRGLIVFSGGQTHGSAPTTNRGWCIMSLMYWVFVCCFVTAANAVPLRFLLWVVHAVPFMAGLMRTVHDCCEGRLWVKGGMGFEWCLRCFERWTRYAGELTRWIRDRFEKVRDIGNWWRCFR